MKIKEFSASLFRSSRREALPDFEESGFPFVLSARPYEDFVLAQNKIFLQCVAIELSRTGDAMRAEDGLPPLDPETDIESPATAVLSRLEVRRRLLRAGASEEVWRRFWYRARDPLNLHGTVLFYPSGYPSTEERR